MLTILLLTSCFSTHITGARIQEVIPLESQGEFFVVTQETRADFFGHFYDINSQNDILRCFNSIDKTESETICFSVFDTGDALDMAIKKEDGDIEIRTTTKR